MNDICLKEFMDMRAKLAKRVWFEDSADYDIITDWILRTHEQGRVPSIIVTGPICSGKTELARAMTELAHNVQRYEGASIKFLSNVMKRGIIPVLDDPLMTTGRHELYDLMENGNMMLISKDIPSEEAVRDILHMKMKTAPEEWTQGA